MELPLSLTGPVVTVTANPAMDQTYVVDRLLAGESHRVLTPQCRAGGKGLNAARVVHQTGHPVLAVTHAGGSSGLEFAEDLTASGVAHTMIPVAPSTRRSMAFFDQHSGETSIFNEYGHALSAEEWDALNAAIDDNLRGAGCLVGSGSLPEGAPADFYPQLVVRAEQNGVPCIIDTSGNSLLAAAEAGADVLKPNERELLEATGASTILDGAHQLLRLGAGMIFVSRGDKGMRLYSGLENPVLQARLPQRLEGNPTGAGDAAVAAIAVVLAAGWDDPRTMLRLATAWSAAAVLMPVAGELHASYRDLEESVEITSSSASAKERASWP